MATPDSITKCCSKCGQEYPATREYFSPDKRASDGFYSACKPCRRRQNRKSYQKDIEASRKRARINAKKSREANLEKSLKRERKYKEDNREAIRQRERLRYQANPETFHQKSCKWKSANKEALRIYALKVRPLRREAKRINQSNRRARLRKAIGSYTPNDVQQQKKAQTNRKGELCCWWCGNLIKGTYPIDHRIPLAKDGRNDAGNICISCPSCNLSKNDKLPHEFNGRLL